MWTVLSIINIEQSHNSVHPSLTMPHLSQELQNICLTLSQTILHLSNNYCFKADELERVDTCMLNLVSIDVQVLAQGLDTAKELLYLDDIRKSKIIPHRQRLQIFQSLKRCEQILRDDTTLSFGDVDLLI